MIFKEIYNEIEENIKNHRKGYYNCIPFVGMSRLEETLPGIEQSTFYNITASTGVGKSKLCRYLFIHNTYEYVKNNPDSKIKLSIKYFSLEESRKKVILSEISKYLYSKYGLSISIRQLQSKGRFNYISEDVLDKIKEAEEYIEEFLKTVEIIENIKNPTGIYKYVRDYALTVGTYYAKTGEALSPFEVEEIRTSKGEEILKQKMPYYKLYDPKHYVIIICDHVSLLQSEVYNKKSLSLKETMDLYSSKYCLLFRDRFGFIPVNVQQQASSKEQVQYNFQGKTIEEKLEPSLDGYGDSKTTGRDANVVLGLFAPDRYNIETHNRYNIKILGDRYRSLSLLKSRDGASNVKLPLFFNGANDFFKELPRFDDEAGLIKVYDYITKLNNK